MTKQLDDLAIAADVSTRRVFLRRAAVLSVLGTVSGVFAGAKPVAAVAGTRAMGMSESAQGDGRLLNVALGLEYQAIAAYQVGAESELLTKSVLELALQFQQQHKEHAHALKSTLRELGVSPIAEKAALRSGMGNLARAYGIPASKLHSQRDVLHYAAGLEEGAAKAYLSTVSKFHDRAIAHAAASIEGDEAMHWAVLRNALGLNPVPSAFI